MLKSKCEAKNIAETQATRGKMNNHPGLMLHHNEKGKAKICMPDCVEETTEDSEEHEAVGAIAKTQAAECLFEAGDNIEKSGEAKAMMFHDMTARALNLSRRTRRIHKQQWHSSLQESESLMQMIGRNQKE